MRRLLLVLTLILATTLTSAWLHRPVAPTDDDARQWLGADDMPYPRDVAPGKTRVLIIGDSFTWGAGLPEGARFADALARAHPELEVVTLAPKGANTPMLYDYWRDYGRDVNADIVILAISNDDNTLGLLPRPSQETSDWMLPPYYHAPTRALWGDILTRFREDIEAHGAQAWAFVLVHPFFRDETQTLEMSLDTMSLAQGAGFRTFNFLPVYQFHYGDLLNDPARWVAPDDSHYNAETHRVIAAWLWGLLRGSWDK